MLHPDDELLSALLDGEAPSGDVAHVDGCAECQARAASLRRVASVVAAPVRLPPAHLREASLAIAMGAAAAKPAARANIGRWNGLTAAAALLVALAVGGLLISQLPRNGTDEVPSANAQRDTSSAAAPGGGVSNESAISGTDDAAGPYQAGNIGSVDDIVAVFNRSTADLQNPERPMSMLAEASECTVEIAGRTVWQASLTYNGEAGLAFLVETETGSVMQILRRTGCAVLASQEFAPTRPR